MGTITKTGEITAHPSSYDTSNYSWASVNTSYPISNAYTDSSSTSYAQVNWKTGTNAETYVYLRFDFSAIPAGATIKSVTAKAKGYVNTTNSSRVVARQMQLSAGTTLKGSALTMSTSTSEQTFSNTGTWTRAELLTAGVRFYVKRGTSNTASSYNLRMYGATMTVVYEYQETSYTISVNNSTQVPVSANPAEVAQGESSEIRADSVSGLAIQDNGTDVTSQFALRTVAAESYSVTNCGLAVFSNFELNGSGYYESGNKARASTAALCHVDFHVPVAATITFSLINYAEATYDFGLLGEIDAVLSPEAVEDTAGVYWSGKNNNSASVQTVTYQMPAGDHQIYVKFFKDQYTDSNNDSLQFKVAITLNEPFTPYEYYGYDIVNVQADHTITVTQSGGNPPVITVGAPSKAIISDETGYDQCVCTFTSDLALQQWEARATKAGITPARGVGLLVESGGALAAGATGTVYVENEELTDGDGEYTITVYGQSTGGIWSA